MIIDLLPGFLARRLVYLRVLVSMGLFLRYFKVIVDWRLGDLDCAVSHLEGMVSLLEDTVTKPDKRTRVDGQMKAHATILADFYALLTRIYLQAGHVDDAMLVIIRANKTLYINRLRGFAGLDVGTAHLIRAGIVAGRLLDGGGTATLVVRTTVESGHETHRRSDEDGGRERREAKVIPFPRVGEINLP